MTDLCDFCQQNFVTMHTLVGRSDEEKQKQLMAMKAHLEKADEERKYYNAIIKRTRNEPDFLVLHFSFDMAQKVRNNLLCSCTTTIVCVIRVLMICR